MESQALLAPSPATLAPGQREYRAAERRSAHGDLHRAPYSNHGTNPSSLLNYGFRRLPLFNSTVVPSNRQKQHIRRPPSRTLTCNSNICQTKSCYRRLHSTTRSSQPRPFVTPDHARFRKRLQPSGNSRRPNRSPNRRMSRATALSRTTSPSSPRSDSWHWPFSFVQHDVLAPGCSDDGGSRCLMHFNPQRKSFFPINRAAEVAIRACQPSPRSCHALTPPDVTTQNSPLFYLHQPRSPHSNCHAATALRLAGNRHRHGGMFDEEPHRATPETRDFRPTASAVFTYWF